MWRPFTILAVSLTLLGCDGLVCGEGTVGSGGRCVAAVVTKCGVGTTWELGYCVPIDAGPTEDTAPDASER